MESHGVSKIIGMGDICIITNLGYKMVLKDVRHVPNLRLNLISIGKLDDEGYVTHHGDGQWNLKNDSLIMAKGKKYYSLYRIEVQISKDEIKSISQESLSDLWHQRLNHMSGKGLENLVKRNSLPNLKGTLLASCDHCLVGKHHRISFSCVEAKRKIKILDLVYFDICGCMNVKSLYGALYFITFINDASRKFWSFTMKRKDQVHESFQKFHVMVERQTSK